VAPVAQNASYVVVQSATQLSVAPVEKVPPLADDVQQVPPDMKFGRSPGRGIVFPNVHC